MLLLTKGLNAGVPGWLSKLVTFVTVTSDTLVTMITLGIPVRIPHNSIDPRNIHRASDLIIFLGSKIRKTEMTFRTWNVRAAYSGFSRNVSNYLQDHAVPHRKNLNQHEDVSPSGIKFPLLQFVVIRNIISLIYIQTFKDILKSKASVSGTPGREKENDLSSGDVVSCSRGLPTFQGVCII